VVTPADGSAEGRVARLHRSPGGRILTWRGRALQPLAGPAAGATHFDIETGERFRIASAPAGATVSRDDD
jgi:hypothetical protein